jgi:hypothetical protein
VRRPVLAAIALSLLALLFGWETRQALEATPGRQDNSATAPAGVWQPGVSAPDPQPPSDPTQASSAVAARPLFRPDRQPFREQGASARNYDAELSRYTLLGVLGFGDAPYGVVVGKAGSKGERWEVKKGDPFQGFTVKEVAMEGLRLMADGKEFLLPLYAGAPTAAGGAVRTEAGRRDAAQAPPAPGFPASVPRAAAPVPRAAAPVPQAAAPAPAPGFAPSASPLSRRMRRPPPTPGAPGTSPAPLPSDTSPVVTPRSIPGMR